MIADIEAKQNWFSKYISKNANLESFMKLWTNNWDWSHSKKENYIKTVLSKLNNYTTDISLYDKFSEINSRELAWALAKAEWFKWWNKLYNDYNS